MNSLRHWVSRRPRIIDGQRAKGLIQSMHTPNTRIDFLLLTRFKELTSCYTHLLRSIAPPAVPVSDAMAPASSGFARSTICVDQVITKASKTMAMMRQKAQWRQIYCGNSKPRISCPGSATYSYEYSDFQCDQWSWHGGGGRTIIRPVAGRSLGKQHSHSTSASQSTRSLPLSDYFMILNISNHWRLCSCNANSISRISASRHYRHDLPRYQLHLTLRQTLRATTPQIKTR